MTAPPTESLGFELELPDQSATERLARCLAAQAGLGDVIALAGDLGAGKTTFARAFIAALSAERPESVPSPTFTLVQIYDLAPVPVWHFDLYRLERPDEALELGLEEGLTDAICLIEWPERLGSWLPADRLELELHFATEPDARRASVRAGPRWHGRLGRLRLEAAND